MNIMLQQGNKIRIKTEVTGEVIMGHGGSLVESTSIVRRVMGSTSALATT